jgi:hypothetical protein
MAIRMGGGYGLLLPLAMGVLFALFAIAGLTGLMPLVDEAGNAESRTTLVLPLVVGVLLGGGAIRVLRRNHV